MSGILLDPEFYEDIISLLKLIGDHFTDEVKRNGIISSSGSFWGTIAGDHLRVGDHFGVGIILGASEYSLPQHKQFVLIWNYEEIILSFSLSSAYSSGLCCSSTGYRYPPGKSLSSG